MESDAKYALVGAFVLVATLLTIAAILWLSEAFGERAMTSYSIYFRHHGLEGLQKDSDVTMKGIKVGTVIDYHMSPRSVEVVKVIVELDEETPVKVDTRATLRRNLLTGLAWIDLVGSTEETPRLKDTVDGEEYPIILEGRTELEKITESIPDLLEKTNTLMSRINEVVSADNVLAVRTSLQNVERTTQVFAENRERISTIFKDLQLTLDDLRGTSAKLKSLASTADGSLKELRDQSSETLKAIEQTAQTIGASTQEMAVAVKGATNVLAQETSTLAQTVGAAATSVSRAAEGFDDPRTILTGPRKTLLGPGEVIQE